MTIGGQLALDGEHLVEPVSLLHSALLSASSTPRSWTMIDEGEFKGGPIRLNEMLLMVTR